MKIIGLSHRMSIHTLGWVSAPANKMYYGQNLQKNIKWFGVDTGSCDQSGGHFDPRHAAGYRS